ncbi:helix-turn-helix domain-containing protein [Natronolimnohabitans sp. A-GB9]|uniref:helix-turn-helix domain-containing protein n=1 Tax=Natronolimnohabitans sp. A-GB9 TaxID=3069757 RepID=UPI0027B6389C|nr:helix-turn-helix domain-containing protein [Natronolimnohabitans sp. A-GB9]MDQ2052096.1 helix-turn-helix domain-containing protein [Natronolimnohabitans sp. A-GB9]
MADSMAEQLQQEMVCEGLLECIHGLKRLDKECYRVLVESDEPLTIDAVADRVDRERSTAYRSIQRLLESGLLQKEQINYDQGGYYHVYYPTDPTQIANDMQRTINDWYAKMSQLIQAFEDKYDQAETVDTPETDDRTAASGDATTVE